MYLDYIQILESISTVLSQSYIIKYKASKYHGFGNKEKLDSREKKVNPHYVGKKIPKKIQRHSETTKPMLHQMTYRA